MNGRHVREHDFAHIILLKFFSVRLTVKTTLCKHPKRFVDINLQKLLSYGCHLQIKKKRKRFKITLPVTPVEYKNTYLVKCS